MILRLAPVTFALIAAQSAEVRAQGAIPRGSALWWACTEPIFDGPSALACPRGYDPRYVETFKAGFDRLTPENEFKMAFLQPREGEFDLSLADRIVRFAQAHGKEVRGHTLIWGQALPGWLTKLRLLGWSRADALAVLRRHVETVVAHFAAASPGVVREWDVVNEPLDSAGQLAGTFWAKQIGPDYIEHAFLAARKADPGAVLVLNEVGADRPGPKADALYSLVRDLRARSVPVDAVGLQMHLPSPAAAPSSDELLALMRRYADIGVSVEITEMDVAIGAGGADGNAEREQADAYRRVASACRAAGNCTGFTTWGVADPYSWLGENERALMFDSGFMPKPQVAEVNRILSPQSPRTTPVRRRKAGARGRSRRRADAARRRCRAAERTRRPRRCSNARPLRSKGAGASAKGTRSERTM